MHYYQSIKVLCLDSYHAITSLLMIACLAITMLIGTAPLAPAYEGKAFEYKESFDRAQKHRRLEAQHYRQAQAQRGYGYTDNDAAYVYPRNYPVASNRDYYASPYQDNDEAYIPYRSPRKEQPQMATQDVTPEYYYPLFFDE